VQTQIASRSFIEGYLHAPALDWWTPGSLTTNKLQLNGRAQLSSFGVIVTDTFSIRSKTQPQSRSTPPCVVPS
jgi:hypothetical protein